MDVFGLVKIAWRYLSHHWRMTSLLVASIALILFLPIGLRVLVDRSAASLLERAESTSVLIGAQGSPLELVLDAMYFKPLGSREFPFGELDRVQASGLADAIPLNTRYQSDGYPIVGTSIDYFRFRDLDLVSGRQLIHMGECVVGAELARELNVSVGDSVISSPEQVFDFAGVYPLKMEIVGVLGFSGTADDRAIFTDIKTVWAIAGYAHGHQDLAPEEDGDDGAKHVVAKPSELLYHEINASNRDSFHFHGALSEFPLTAIIAIPQDARAQAVLEGRYVGKDESMQVVHPAVVIARMLETVFTVERYITIGAFLAGGATLLITSLVFLFSFRMRAKELETMRRVGIPERSIIGVLAIEVGAVLSLAVAFAIGLTVIAVLSVDSLIQSFLW